MNAFGLCLPYVRGVKVSKRKEFSPRTIKERGKLMKEGSEKVMPWQGSWNTCQGHLSWMHLLVSKISHICQEICDIKDSRKKQLNFTSIQEGLANSTEGPIDTGDLGTKKDHHTVEPSNSRKDTCSRDDWDGTYSTHSILCPHSFRNPYTPAHHAPAPHSQN